MWIRRLCMGRSFVFSGNTKKIAYADGMEGVQVIPVQGMTAILFITAGLAGVYAFLKGHFSGAYLGTLIVTQVWRILSEFIRADYRGGHKLSAYQFMSVLCLPYGVWISWFFSGSVRLNADVVTGIISLWNPGLIIFIQLVWITVFLYTGRSSITGARMSFHVMNGKT